MYIVCAKNDFCLLGYEYFGKSKDSKSAVGYHDPRLADLFNTKKEAQEFARKFDYKTNIEDADKHFKKFEKATYVYRRIPFVDNTKSIKYDPLIHSNLDVLNFFIDYRTGNEKAVRYEDYTTWPQIWSVFKYLWEVQQYNSKDYKSRYTTFSLCVRRDKSPTFEEFKKEFELVKDHCTYMSEDGYKVFPIFDKDLSEWGTRYLYYKDDLDCKIVESMWQEHEGSLEKCYNLMLSRFYYE